MSKAIRIAVVVIVGLIVVQIAGAMLIEVLVSGGSSSQTESHVYAGPDTRSFTSQLSRGEVRSVAIDTFNQTLQVTGLSGEQYVVAYPDRAALRRLLKKYPAVEVLTGEGGASDSWWTWPYLLLPTGLLLTFGALAFVVLRSLKRSRASRQESDELERRLAALQRRRERAAGGEK